MATIKDIRESFFALTKKEQEAMLKDIYSYSKDVKEFLNMRLLGADGGSFLEQIRKVTQSSTKTGMPKIIKVTSVNSVISKAKKAKVSKDILCEMEWIAFDGYMTSLNDYGGGPESYENKVYTHLENYLLLVTSIERGEKLTDELEAAGQYLQNNTNMYYDHIWELFEEITGMKVEDC